jgi:hypothetical protein
LNNVADCHFDYDYDFHCGYGFPFGIHFGYGFDSHCGFDFPFGFVVEFCNYLYYDYEKSFASEIENFDVACNI